MPRITVERLMVGGMAVNCYIVENADTHACLIVDPGADAQRIMQRVGQRMPAAVLLTHGHFDHIGAVDEICLHYGIPLYMHEADAVKLGDPEANVSALFGASLVQHTKPVLLQGGDHVELAGLVLEVLHTPGHSAGSCCYLLPDGQGVLTGDTLFAHGYGRTDFPDGDFGQLRESLRLLFHLTPKMIAYPGHEALGFVGRDAAEEA